MDEIEVLDFEEKPKKKKLKKSVKIFLMLIILVISLIIGCRFMLSSVSNDDKQISFEIKSGSSVYSVGEKLKREGFIRSIYAYKLYVKLKGINEYKAGIYTLKKSYDTKKIIDVLKDGKYNTEGIKITFKEGKNIRYVAKQIANNTNISEADFLNLLSDDEYIDSLIDANKNELEKSGAILREEMRWGDRDLDYSTQNIKDFYSKKIELLDGYYGGI